MPSSQWRNASLSFPSIVAASHGSRISIISFVPPFVNHPVACESVAWSSKKRSRRDSSSCDDPILRAMYRLRRVRVQARSILSVLVVCRGSVTRPRCAARVESREVEVSVTRIYFKFDTAVKIPLHAKHSQSGTNKKESDILIFFALTNAQRNKQGKPYNSLS